MQISFNFQLIFKKETIGCNKNYLIFGHCFMFRSAKNLISGDKQNIDSTHTINQVASEQPPKFQLRSEDILIQYQRMFNYDVYTPPTTAGTLREMTLYIATVLRKSYHPCFWDIEWFYTTPSSLYNNFPLYCFRIHTQKYIFCRLLSLYSICR